MTQEEQELLKFAMVLPRPDPGEDKHPVWTEFLKRRTALRKAALCRELPGWWIELSTKREAYIQARKDFREFRKKVAASLGEEELRELEMDLGGTFGEP